MFCHQSPPKTCGQGNLTVCSAWDTVASPTRWCVVREAPHTTASPKAVGSEGGRTWLTEVNRE
jgi:hypothetical protein